MSLIDDDAFDDLVPTVERERVPRHVRRPANPRHARTFSDRLEDGFRLLNQSEDDHEDLDDE